MFFDSFFCVTFLEICKVNTLFQNYDKLATQLQMIFSKTRSFSKTWVVFSNLSARTAFLEVYLFYISLLLNFGRKTAIVFFLLFFFKLNQCYFTLRCINSIIELISSVFLVSFSFSTVYFIKISETTNTYLHPRLCSLKKFNPVKQGWNSDVIILIYNIFVIVVGFYSRYTEHFITKSIKLTLF